MTRLLTALAALLERLLEAWQEWRREQEQRKQRAERDSLRESPVGWWQRNFGVDGADDIRLRDAAKSFDAETGKTGAGNRAD